ncbi:MAG: glycosyltransferase [Candidatus Dormibacteraeota bacterium]|nr:glycosyltransferase [Candidatus Dormibacteraeota bacterium]
MAAAPTEPLGQLLVRRGVIDEDELESALLVGKAQRLRLGEALVAAGVKRTDIWGALAEQWGMSPIDVTRHWVDPGIANELDAQGALWHQVLPLREAGAAVVVAMADPTDREAQEYLESHLHMPVVARLASPDALRRRQEQVYRQQLVQVSSALLQAKTPEYSAHMMLSRQQKVALAIAGVLAVALAIVMRGSFAIAISGAVIVLYAAVVIFRTYVTVRAARSRGLVRISSDDLDALTDFPTYTILLPLFKEAGVLPQLLTACRDLDYPPSKLDIKLLLEEDDHTTREVVARTELPANVDVVVVPAEGPRTKPKACKYGLQFARGEYCVIYDAEDIPPPDQLKKALVAFRSGDPDVGCVQARLDYYNPDQNLITKWFTLEYTMWFRLFLPGLVDLRLPVPLGGSSNHFPTPLLRRLDAWDPNNVTEDADLGMRLHRLGYQTLLMDSTTMEEANSDFVNWMRQRSRWGKGYFVSWLVLMRTPLQVWRAMGWRGTLAMQLILGGTFGIALLNLFLWLLTGLWILAHFDFIEYLFPSWIYYTGMLEMLFGNFFFLYLGLWAARTRDSFELNHAALLIPVYWAMTGIAMIKSGVQTVSNPQFWEKTRHGLGERRVT